MPAGYDEQLAIIFKEMRRAAGTSKEEMATRLATSVAVIGALESGAVQALPEWSELERIVTAYTAELGLDARPVLRRLKSQVVVEEPLVTPAASPASPPVIPPVSPPAIPPVSSPAAPLDTSSASRTPAANAHAPQPGALPMPPSVAAAAQPGAEPAQPVVQDPPPLAQGWSDPPKPKIVAPAAEPGPKAAPAEPQDRAQKREAVNRTPGSGRLVRSIRPIINWVVLLGFVAALGTGVWYAAKHPRAVWSVLDSLPEPVPRLMRSAWQMVRPLEEVKPRRQVSDPVHRKTDRLR